MNTVWIVYNDETDEIPAVLGVFTSLEEAHEFQESLDYEEALLSSFSLPFRFNEGTHIAYFGPATQGPISRELLEETGNIGVPPRTTRKRLSRTPFRKRISWHEGHWQIIMLQNAIQRLKRRFNL